MVRGANFDTQRIHILNIGLIEDTPMGRLISTNLLAFAEFERAMIIERTQSGKIIAKSKPDFREGRPKVYGKKQIEHALTLLETNSYKQVEEITGISKSTLVQKIDCSLSKMVLPIYVYFCRILQLYLLQYNTDIVVIL